MRALTGSRATSPTRLLDRYLGALSSAAACASIVQLFSFGHKPDPSVCSATVAPRDFGLSIGGGSSPSAFLNSETNPVRNSHCGISSTRQLYIELSLALLSQCAANTGKVVLLSGYKSNQKQWKFLFVSLSLFPLLFVIFGIRVFVNNLSCLVTPGSCC